MAASPGFPRFMELPTELQVKVWNHAILDLNFTPDMLSALSALFDDLCAFNNHYGHFICHIPPATKGLLYVCRLSRLLCLEGWQRELEGMFFDEDFASPNWLANSNANDVKAMLGYDLRSEVDMMKDIRKRGKKAAIVMHGIGDRIGNLFEEDEPI